MRNGLWIIVVGGVVGTMLAAGLAVADPPKEELAKCQARLNTCTTSLSTCQTDLAACETEPNAVFPGDGGTGQL